MDNNQSTQQSSNNDLHLARARRRGSAKSSGLNSLFALLRSPWLLWPLLWLILLLAATFSIFSLTFTGFVNREEPVPLVVQVPDVATSGSDRVAIWAIGAMVACAAGYWVVFRQLQGSSQPKKQRQRRQRRSHKSRQRQLQILPVQQPATSTRVKPLTVVEPNIPEPIPEPPVVETAEPTIPEPPVVEVKETNPISDSNGINEEPIITILPPEDSQQVDVEKVSLAEMMDIRKHRPLSSILGKTYDEETED